MFFLFLILFAAAETKIAYADQRLCDTSCRTSCCPINSTPCDNVLRQQLDRIDTPVSCPVCDVCQQNCSVNNNLACQNECVGRTIFIPRSVGANTARELVGWQNYIHQVTECNYLSFAASVGYSRSFKPERLAQLLFGSPVINFAGSQLTDRRNCEWIADYFGLPTTFRGSVSFAPRIENIYLDTNIFIGLDELACGLYLRVHAPLVHTKWGLHACEQRTTTTESSFPPCYMSGGTARATQNIREALSGNFIFGDQIVRRQFANIDFKSHTRTRLADIDFIVGYDFWKCSDYYFGFYSQLVAPTGNKPCPERLFDPIVGNAKHWELGIGVAGSALIWECPDNFLRVYLDGNVTHMFANNQLRSFDLCCNGRFSRYLLAKEFAQDGVSYTGNLIPVVNATTLPVRVNVPLKGDISVKLSYETCGLQIDLGYNFYGHTREHLKLCADQLAHKNIGIKGTQGTCYAMYGTSGNPTEFGSLIGTAPLNSTESCARITQAAPVDNPQTPQTGANTITTAWNNTRVTGPASGTDLVLAQISQPPVLLSVRDVNICSGKACPFVTHKVFTFVGYTGCSGFIGVGGEVEFEGLARNERSSLNQWSVYVKAGFSY